MYIIIIFPLLFLSTLISVGQVLNIHWTDYSEIWGYGRYGCEVVHNGFQDLKSRTLKLAHGRDKKRGNFVLTISH